MLLLHTNNAAVEVSGRDISLTFKRLDAIPQIRLDLVMHSQLIDNYSANIFITLGIWTVIQRRLTAFASQTRLIYNPQKKLQWLAVLLGLKSCVQSEMAFKLYKVGL